MSSCLVLKLFLTFSSLSFFLSRNWFYCKLNESEAYENFPENANATP